MHHLKLNSGLFTLLSLFSTALFAQTTDTVSLCNPNGQLVSTAPNGLLYDSGGPFGSYGDGQYCTLLIDPGCATALTFNLQEYVVENCCDVLRVYDGDNENAPLLLDMYVQQAPQTVVSTSGKLFIRWSSDGSVMYSGFRATWSATLVPPVLPVANFAVSDSQPALQESVQFTAIATNYPNVWNWNFGDNTASAEQNPVHAWNAPGTYTVRLIVTNCHNLKDTVEQTVQVQQAPFTEVDPASLDVTVACGDTAQAVVTLTNTGQGDLLFDLSGQYDASQKVLLFTNGAYYESVTGVTAAMDDYPGNYELSFSAAADSATFAAELSDKDVLIFPDLISSEAAWTLMTLRGAIEDFVEAGGSVIVCGHSYYNAVSSATALLDAENDYTYNFSGSVITFGGPHPLTENLPASYYTPYFSGGHVFLNPDYVSLSNINNYSLLGYRFIGRSKIVYLGFNYQLPDAALAQLLANAVQWCGSRSLVRVEPEEGMLAPGASTTLNIQFLTTNQFAGDYTGTITIGTNNPAQPTVEVPFTLHIQGTAVFVPTPSALDFGVLMQHREKSQVVRIDNPGCDILTIQTITSSLAGYIVEPVQLSIPPFSSDSITATFAPSDTGLYAGDLVFTGNIGVFSIPLTGYATGAPVAGISPPSLEATVSCGDSVLLEVTVTNTGLGDLEISTGATASAGNAPLKLLVIYRGTYDYFICNQVTGMLQQRFPNAAITIFDTQPLSELPGLLDENQVAVIPFVGYFDPSFYSEMGQIIRPYAEEGGGVIFTGTFSQQNLNAYGLLQISTNSNGFYAPPLTVLDPDHPLMANSEFQTPVFDDVFGHSFTSPDFKPLIQMYQWQAAGVQQVGQGKVAYLGFRYAYYFDNTVQVLENAVRWCSRPEWIATDPATLTVAPGDSATVQVKFRSETLVEDTYISAINWTTNDPLSPQIAVACTLHVEGEPLLESPLTNLNFGIIQQFSEKVMEVPVRNNGCDTLNLSAPAVDNPVFVVTDYPGFILPGKEGVVKIVFTPLLPGGQNATLTITSDGGAATVLLAGNAVGAPVATASPASLEISLNCDESITVPVTLNNSGLGGYNFQTGGLNSTRRILGLTFGANNYRWENFRNHLLQYVPNATVTAYAGANANALADSLAKKDVLVIPSLDLFSDPVLDTYKPIIQNFLTNGGQVLVLGGNYAQPLMQMGLFDNFFMESSYFPNVQVTNATHPLALDAPTEYQVNDYCFFGIFPANSDVRTVIQGFNANQTFLGYRKAGAGNVVYWGQSFEYSDPNAIQLEQNIFSWFANPVPDGVKILGTGGNIPAGGSQTIQVQFDGTGLPGGQYLGSIRLTGNDPVNNPLVIPVTLNMGYQPCADFGYQIPPCSGQVSFFDNTVNALTSWYWEFGDGASAFVQNPVHTYAAGGNYPVTLIGCNNSGCDTITQSVEISPFEGPAGINCQPETTGWCCDAGIYRVQIGALDHVSGNASEGYQDFSCSEGTELMAGSQYPVKVTTGPQLWEHVKVWIDFNNNGNFATNELVFSDQAFILHEGFITLPLTAVKDVPLRMRVVSESTWNNPPASPCNNLTYGQAEDYFVTLKTTIGTTEPDNSQQIRLYPNPSPGDTWLEFSLAASEPVTIRIADQTGRLVWENTLENTAPGLNKLRLPELPAGAFAVTVQSGISVSVLKLIRVERP